MHTKGSILRFALAFALRNVRVARYRLGLSEDQRYAVADEVMRELRRTGGWNDLDEPVEPVHQWDRDSQHGNRP